MYIKVYTRQAGAVGKCIIFITRFLFSFCLSFCFVSFFYLINLFCFCEYNVTIKRWIEINKRAIEREREREREGDYMRVRALAFIWRVSSVIYSITSSALAYLPWSSVVVGIFAFWLHSGRHFYILGLLMSLIIRFLFSLHTNTHTRARAHMYLLQTHTYTVH